MSDPVRRRRRRAVRWLLFVIVAGALWFGIVRRFRIVTIDIATADAMVPALRPGARHLVDGSPSFALERGWIVWWRWSDGTLFSRVAGCPGDRFARRDGRWVIEHPGRDSSMLRPEVSLDDDWDGRELVPGFYFLLNDRLDVRWPDSREVGPIARERIVARVLFAFDGGDGP